MTVRAISTPSSAWQIHPARDFPDWSDRWRALNEQGARTPALDTRLIAALIDEFADADVHLAVLGNPAAPMAMLLVRRASAIAWNVFTADFAPIAPVVAARDVDLGAEWPRLLSRLPGMPQMLLASDLDPDIVPRPRPSPLLSIRDDFVTHRLALDTSFDRYLAERSRNFRSNINRQRNLLSRRGLQTRLEMVTAPEAMSQLVREHASLERSGWKGEAGTAIDPSTSSGRFFERLMTEMAATGDAIGCRYLYDETVVAAYLGIRGFGAELALKWAYDERYSDTSPGHHMRLEMLRRLFEQREVDRFEFMGGGSWQNHWSTDTRAVYQLHCYRSSAAVSAHLLWKAAKSRLGLRRSDPRALVLPAPKSASGPA